MRSEEKQKQWGSDRLWSRTALVSGIFAILISVLLIANYLQYRKVDPVNMTVMSGLVSRLNDNPADSTLRVQIRSLDLLYRKAYFTSQWQIRTGGYFLLIAVALVVISLQIIEYRKKADPLLSSGQEDIMQSQRRKARVWIVAGGGAMLLVAIVFAIMGSNELGKKFNDIANGVTSAQEVQAQAVNEPSAPAVQETQQAEQNLAPAETTAETISAPVASGNDNFPNFRGTGGTGIISKNNVPESWDGPSGKNILWKTAIPLPGHNSPVVWGEKVFLTGANDQKQEIYCFNRNDGKIIWTTGIGKGNKKPTVSDYTGYAPSTAVTDGKAVFAIFPTGDMAAVDMNGKIIWEKDFGVPENHYGHASSLMMFEDKIIVQYDQASNPRVMAVSAKNGQVVWSTSRKVSPSWASPIIVNTGRRNELILVAEPGIASYNPSNGQELWNIEAVGGEVGPSPAYANGIVFALNDNSKLAAVKLGPQPSILWENNEFLADIPSPVATDKYLFVATSYGVLVCYDAVNGTKYWEHSFENNIYSSPMLVNDKLYVLRFDGVMYIIKADKQYQEVGQSALGENCLGTPAYTNGRIFVRGDGNLYCIGK